MTQVRWANNFVPRIIRYIAIDAPRMRNAVKSKFFGPTGTYPRCIQLLPGNVSQYLAVRFLVATRYIKVTLLMLMKKIVSLPLSIVIWDTESSLEFWTSSGDFTIKPSGCSEMSLLSRLQRKIYLWIETKIYEMSVDYLNMLEYRFS